MTQPGPPLISVIIPVHGVRRHLAECLDSVLGPAPGEAVEAGQIEVIAVDDASPDDSGALLDERAARDSRLTVIHTGRNLGPGGARNTGLRKAAGSYVWFVDGDDFVPAGAFAAITARLAQDRPDLLLIDYQDHFPDGSTRPSPGARLLRAAPPGTFTLAEAPGLIDLTMTAWSKLFRRDFLLALRQPFGPGIHEDIPVTCAGLFAGRLAALDRVCYAYRRARHGSFMSTAGGDHGAVFDAYEQVLANLEQLAGAGDPVATPAVRSAVFERAIWHYAAVLQAGRSGLLPFGRAGLVRRGERRAFFARMSADFGRYAPPGYRPPPGARGAKLRLIRRGAYLAYEVLEPVNRLRVTLRGR